MIRTFAAACAVLSLAACSASDEPTEAAPTVAATVAVTETPVATGTGSEIQIPEALRGRWGLVPGDCTSTMGDNKGLIVVDAETIKFYESRATLKLVKEVRESRVLATFSFTGEGQEWTVDEELDLQNGDLVRTETGEGAMPEPLRYKRCA